LGERWPAVRFVNIFVVRSNERVLIVGGGPVGTITGLKLVRDGIPVTIFDSLPEPAPDHRASTLQPSTLDLLEELDMLPRIHEQGLPSPVFQWRDIPTGEIVEFDYRILADECKHPYVIQLEQHRTIAAALEVAQRYADYELIRSVNVIAIRQSSDGVAADVQFPDGRVETFTGTYLIGCDGGRSIVRKTIGTTFDGFTWPERFNIIATPFDFAQLGFRFRNYCPHPERWVSLIKVPGEDFRGLWRCIFPAKADESDEFVQSDDWIQARFLADPAGAIGEPALRALAAIRDVLGLDYAGIDFGIDAAGDVVVFEANATMIVLPPGPEPIWAYRRAPVARVIDAARAMLRARAAVRR